MLSAVSITLCGAIGGRLLREMGASLRGLMAAAVALATRPATCSMGRSDVRLQSPCRPEFGKPEFGQDDLMGLRGERVMFSSQISSGQIIGTEGKYHVSHNILGWLNSDRDNWSGETRVIIPSLI
jgi:hypothetical protein